MHTTSASLLMRLREPGQAEAWTRFVRLYSPMLMAWCRRMGLQAADAADLVQEVFATLVQKMPKFDYDNQQRFRGWLWTITKNKLRDRRRQRALPRDADVPLDDLPAPPAEELDEIELRRHLLARILSTIQQRFEPGTWRAFWEHVVQGRPVQEVAQELGVTDGAIYTAKCRVLAHLSKEFKTT